MLGVRIVAVSLNLNIIITFIVIIGVTTFGIFKFEHKEEVVPENPSLKDQKRYEGTYICMKRLAKEASVKEVRIEHTIIDDEHAREFIVHQYTAYIREEGERLVEIQNELLGLDYECTNYVRVLDKILFIKEEIFQLKILNFNVKTVFRKKKN